GYVLGMRRAHIGNLHFIIKALASLQDRPLSDTLPLLTDSFSHRMLLVNKNTLCSTDIKPEHGCRIVYPIQNRYSHSRGAEVATFLERVQAVRIRSYCNIVGIWG